MEIPPAPAAGLIDTEEVAVVLASVLELVPVAVSSVAVLVSDSESEAVDEAASVVASAVVASAVVSVGVSLIFKYNVYFYVPARLSNRSCSARGCHEAEVIVPSSKTSHKKLRIKDRMAKIGQNRIFGDGEEISNRWVSELLSRRIEPNQPPLAPDSVWRHWRRVTDSTVWTT